MVSQFNPIDSRDDIGALWENFMVTERMKKFACQGLYGSFYFWRTYDGQEIDLVEEREGKLLGCEFKWFEKSKLSPPRAWLAAYSNAEYRVVERENYLDFVL